jgi:exodeoxyribonuclease VII large subunit
MTDPTHPCPSQEGTFYVILGLDPGIQTSSELVSDKKYIFISFLELLGYNSIMFERALQKLTIWRNQTAKQEGVDLFRVLPNKTLEELARSMPKNKEELVQIKGIKEAKFQKYGRDILAILEPETEGNNEKVTKEFVARLDTKKSSRTLSVSEFLDNVNNELSRLGARIQGEVTSVDFRERVIYFGLKDRKDESMMNCFIFRYQYEILGVKIEEGMEIIVEGSPEIYKPYGRLSFKTNTIELQGEGALKKEYELLKKKLEGEGFFDATNKKEVSFLPKRIGLITSREGAAIGDFTTNIGQYGFEIKFINSSVEGKKAVFELIEALKSFQKYNRIDILVIIRGGGSLESLQAFNNEALIRESKKIKVPIICGVGHDRDISLLSLSADISVSTPTAAAEFIKSLWRKEIDKLQYYENNIFNSFDRNLFLCNQEILSLGGIIKSNFQGILERIDVTCRSFMENSLRKIEIGILEKEDKLNNLGHEMGHRFERALAKIENKMEKIENIIYLNSPIRQLRLGYSIISKDDAGIKSVEEICKDDIIKIRFFDGEVKSQVKSVKKLLQKNGK